MDRSLDRRLSSVREEIVELLAAVGLPNQSVKVAGRAGIGNDGNLVTTFESISANRCVCDRTVDRSH